MRDVRYGSVNTATHHKETSKMAERYFQNRHTGAIMIRDDSSDWAAEHDVGWHSDYTEVKIVDYTKVKVVPLDAIVILPRDLPDVRTTPNVYSAATVAIARDWDEPLAEAVGRAHAYLAIAEYLRKNPPVDQAQVNAVLRVLKEVIDGADRETAVDLVRAGLRAEKKEKDR